MGPVSMEVNAKLPDQLTPLSVLFPATMRPEEQLILKLRVKMDLLLNEHSYNIEIKFLTPPKESHWIPTAGGGGCNHHGGRETLRESRVGMRVGLVISSWVGDSLQPSVELDRPCPVCMPRPAGRAEASTDG